METFELCSLKQKKKKTKTNEAKRDMFHEAKNKEPKG